MGGAVCFDKNSNGYFKGGSFKGDVASTNGGDVYIETGACVTFTEINFRASVADKGGAIYTNTDASADVVYSLFDRNAATVRSLLESDNGFGSGSFSLTKGGL